MAAGNGWTMGLLMIAGKGWPRTSVTAACAIVVPPPAAGVLRAGVHSTLHGVVFAIFVQALPCTAEGTVCRVRDTRSLVPRAYGTRKLVSRAVNPRDNREVLVCLTPD